MNLFSTLKETTRLLWSRALRYAEEKVMRFFSTLGETTRLLCGRALRYATNSYLRHKDATVQGLDVLNRRLEKKNGTLDKVIALRRQALYGTSRAEQRAAQGRLARFEARRRRK